MYESYLLDIIKLKPIHIYNNSYSFNLISDQYLQGQRQQLTVTLKVTAPGVNQQ